MMGTLVLNEIVSKVDGAIERSILYRLRCHPSSPQWSYYDGGIGALRGLRRELTGETRTADEQAYDRVADRLSHEAAIRAQSAG